MSKAICYGMIGCGMMGQEHLRNVALIEGAHVGAIFEPDAEMRAQAAQIAPDARFVASVDDVLTSEDVDALVITSPNHLHLPQLEQIAQSRPRPVLVEKPLFTDVADLDRVRALNLNAPVWVAMEYRYMPPVAALIAAAADATGGIRMLTIREHRFPFLPKVGDWNRFNAQTGGTLVEKCCHFFDLMRHVLRDDPVRIMASGGQDVNHLDERYDGQTPDIWDNAYVIVDFKGGARAMLELCMFAEGARYQEEIAAVGPKGKIECLVPGPGRFWPAHLGAPPVPQLVESPRAPKGPRAIDIPVDPALLAAGDHNGSTYYQHARFSDVVRGQGAVEVTLQDGIWAVLMGMAAQESARTGRAMAVDESGFVPV
ncbi:1,5-anhydro-D-fructose reductase [Roseibaca ekhonensis]|jgi:predicted dehydrogenase|uniref:1,5-anhydro-D-fructose reductase n=1 Tax=Roseinatronobacter ekhonensis TaxID=254356 RepID=A0A3B0MPH4_9RHOB|nr:Gfo/Idh/MocA family oxidoreductase [Roseibaca ekhonensis]SUZ32897.1 1,5-anhydro-D-fructose reductase [Roseibaca ekhonensis]